MIEWVKLSDRKPAHGAKVVIKDKDGNKNELFYDEKNYFYLMKKLFGKTMYAITDVVEWLDENIKKRSK